MKLPNAESVRIPREKLVDYLLSTAHPQGRAKAAYFESLGFRQAEWRVLSAALRLHAVRSDVTGVTVTPYGTKYTVDGPLHCPAGHEAQVRTVWIVRETDGVACLVTAYPL
jgi:hypothetical protein